MLETNEIAKATKADQPKGTWKYPDANSEFRLGFHPASPFASRLPWHQAATQCLSR